MSHADAAWLHMDRATNLMVITSVMWTEEPIDRARLREVVVERLVEPFVRFRQLAGESRVPLRGPHWEDDPDFDVERHLHHRALPAPGGSSELEELVSDLMSTPLDRSKPLWDMYVVDGYGSGSAIVARIHHSIADGIALARVMLSLTDEHPDAGIAGEAPGAGDGGGLVPDLLSAATAPARMVGSAATGLVREGLRVLRDPAEAGRLATAASKDARTLAKMLLPSADPESALKGELGVTRRAAWGSELDLDDVKAVGHAAGATVNDVLMAALAGALRDYLRRRDSLPDEVHAIVPFNLRPLDQPLPPTLGNAFGLVFVPLAVGLSATRERLQAVKDAMSEVKDSPEGAISYGVLDLIGRAPVEAERLAVDMFTGKGSMVVTNVPGPKQPVYLARTPVRGVLVWAPTSGSVAMSVSILSYDGRVTVGIMADAHLIPDPERITSAFERELVKLRKLYTS